MRPKLNQDVETRDGILQQYSDTHGKDYDIYHFQGVPEQVLLQLKDNRFLALNEKQNEAPTIKEFLAFMRKHPGLYTAHGYAVRVSRMDYRVSIEGVQAVRELTKEELVDFVDFARHADEFEPRKGFCWWD